MSKRQGSCWQILQSSFLYICPYASSIPGISNILEIHFGLQFVVSLCRWIVIFLEDPVSGFMEETTRFPSSVVGGPHVLVHTTSTCIIFIASPFSLHRDANTGISQSVTNLLGMRKKDTKAASHPSEFFWYLSRGNEGQILGENPKPKKAVQELGGMFPAQDVGDVAYASPSQTVQCCYPFAVLCC